jgi:hypothetical protein
MYRSIGTLALVAMAMCTPRAAMSQQVDPNAPATPAVSVVRQKLSGPRFGFTVFTGDVADLRARVDKEPLITQFGWQFETQIKASESGNQALLEWIFLVGGVEQDELNFSAAWLAGYRVRGGLEVGAGPSLAISKDNTQLRTSMVVATGATAPLGDIKIPVHLAVALAEGGPRITTLVGWIID